MRKFVIPYRAGSKSAKNLAEKIEAKRIKLRGSRHRAKETNLYINWGNSNPPAVVPFNMMLNMPPAIEEVSNKLTFFENLSETGFLPSYWTNAQDIPDDAFPIVCRTVLNGHSGRGIVIADTRDDLVPAPLYVQYVKKADEYRIHLGYRRGEKSIIIATQQKRRRHDHDNPNWKIRNHANGFIYARENVDPPVCVIEAARRVFEETYLDFGAVDVIYNAKNDRAYVLEINTAPGLEGQTLDDYAAHFQTENV